METNKYRQISFYKRYFEEFFARLDGGVRDKIMWTLRLIEEIPQVPESYLKHLTGTDGLYEIRVKAGNGTFRIFCFFDQGRLIILLNGFQKKTQKTPRKEIARALKMKKEYYEEKKQLKKS